MGSNPEPLTHEPRAIAMRHATAVGALVDRGYTKSPPKIENIFFTDPSYFQFKVFISVNLDKKGSKPTVVYYLNTEILYAYRN